jgi:hypothetical protein
MVSITEEKLTTGGRVVADQRHVDRPFHISALSWKAPNPRPAGISMK